MGFKLDISIINVPVGIASGNVPWKTTGRKIIREKNCICSKGMVK
jgi:hypothetical protein